MPEEITDLLQLPERELLAIVAIKLTNIEEHLRRQNGTLAKHAEIIDNMNRWRYMTAGGLAILSIVFLPVAIAFVTTWF